MLFVSGGNIILNWGKPLKVREIFFFSRICIPQSDQGDIDGVPFYSQRQGGTVIYSVILVHYTLLNPLKPMAWKGVILFITALLRILGLGW